MSEVRQEKAPIPFVAVELNSIWRSKVSGCRAKVVGFNVSGLLTVAEVVYDRGDGRGFCPSILPSTWALKHWDERFVAEDFSPTSSTPVSSGDGLVTTKEAIPESTPNTGKESEVEK